MARAKRHYIPGYIWHIIHQCHKREFLLKFSRDRHRYLQWLYQARKRYGLTVLNYMVTSNHIHLLVADGMTQAEILRAFPDLEEQDLHEALQYAAEAVRERQLPLMSLP